MIMLAFVALVAASSPMRLSAKIERSRLHNASPALSH
jgi:hypothetical protein